MPESKATRFATPLSSAWSAGLAGPDGLCILIFGSLSVGGIPTTASTFSPGCLAINSAGSSASTSLYGNTGTAASPTWTVLTIS